MSDHEPCVGATDEWYTPPSLLDAIGLRYDLDPCSPGLGHWVPATSIYTKEHGGLSSFWFGRVFVNPPYGGRNDHVPWLVKFLDHGDGIAIFRSYTSAAWFHDHLVRADALLWPRGKTKFVRPDGTVGGSPGHGIVIIGMGSACCEALERSSLGMFWDRRGIR